MPSWWPLWAIPWIARADYIEVRHVSKKGRGGWMIYWGPCTVGPTYDSLLGALGRMLKYRIWRKF